jgi:hypothetical protein
MAPKEIPPVAMQQRSGRKAHNMRTRYFGWEYVFEFVWKNADRDGVRDGNASTVAVEFGVTEDEAHEALGEICDTGHIEEVYPGTYAISKWRERDDRDEEELPHEKRWL